MMMMMTFEVSFFFSLVDVETFKWEKKNKIKDDFSNLVRQYGKRLVFLLWPSLIVSIYSIICWHYVRIKSILMMNYFIP